MYRIVAYHGKGDNKELEGDLRLLWGGFREFLKHRLISHVYCFQSVSDKNIPLTLLPLPNGERVGVRGKEANLLLLVQYGDNVATKLALDGKAKQASQLRNHVDYWFYVREEGNKKW